MLRYCCLNQRILQCCILASLRFLISILLSSTFPFPRLFFLVLPRILILIGHDCNDQTSSTSIFDSRLLQFSSQTRIFFAIYICYQRRLLCILHAFLFFILTAFAVTGRPGSLNPWETESSSTAGGDADNRGVHDDTPHHLPLQVE